EHQEFVLPGQDGDAFPRAAVAFVRGSGGVLRHGGGSWGVGRRGHRGGGGGGGGGQTWAAPGGGRTARRGGRGGPGGGVAGGGGGAAHRLFRDGVLGRSRGGLRTGRALHGPRRRCGRPRQRHALIRRPVPGQADAWRLR